jgi:hypothetical protein
MRITALLIAGLIATQPCWPQQSTNSQYGHTTDTNPGKRPAPAPAPERGGSNAGWIAALVAGGALAGGIAAYEATRPQHELTRHGPQTPHEFSMSGFRFTAFTMANWPVGLDFIMDAGGVLTMNIQVDRRTAYTYTSVAGGARIPVRFVTPRNFPNKPTPAVYTITATSRRSRQPVYLRLFGIAAGPRAVGSIAIDEVHFGPERIRPKAKQEAAYTFHTHTDFDRIQAEFMRSVTARGELTSKLEDEDTVKHVLRETNGRGQWNGRKASLGEHMLQLRGWESALDKANWVIAWSTDLVEIEE